MKSGAVGLKMTLLAGRFQGSNCGKGEWFLSSPKLPDWLWVPHSLVVSMYGPVSLGIKRPVRKPKNSRVWSGEVMLLSSKFPSVLRFQLNDQRQLKFVRVSGTDMYSKEWTWDSSYWYSAVGEGLWDEVWIAYSFKFWTAWTVKMEAVTFRYI
jgi:hypothetical protein